MQQKLLKESNRGIPYVFSFSFITESQMTKYNKASVTFSDIFDTTMDFLSRSSSSSPVYIYFLWFLTKGVSSTG